MGRSKAEENSGKNYLEFCLKTTKLLKYIEVQFASWDSNVELPEWMNILEVANSLKANSPLKAQCSEGFGTLSTVYGVFAEIGTAFESFRIVNMIVESNSEYNSNGGFQILHGMIETVLAVLCDDVPQIVLLVCFNGFGKIDLTALAKVTVWMILKDMKNKIRVIWYLRPVICNPHDNKQAA